MTNITKTAVCEDCNAITDDPIEVIKTVVEAHWYSVWSRWEKINNRDTKTYQDTVMVCLQCFQQRGREFFSENRVLECGACDAYFMNTREKDFVLVDDTTPQMMENLIGTFVNIISERPDRVEQMLELVQISLTEPTPREIRHFGHNFDRLCPECYKSHYICNDCDEVISDHEAEYVNSEHVCVSCRENYWYCDHCDYYHYNNERCNCECDSCEDDGSSLIHGYSYKPDPKFYRAESDSRDTKTFFGFELEIEAVNANLTELAETLDQAWGSRAYMKSDGSLNYGLELVSHPMTLAAHRENPWDSLRAASNLGARAWQTSTCGFHVHISRRAFRRGTGMHLYLFGKFFTKNQDFIEGLAGRRSCNYANFDGLDSVIKDGAKGDRHFERYLAINFQNYETIEVRIFRPSLRWQRVMSHLELCHAVLEYTRAITAHAVLHDAALTAEVFCQWVKANAETYPNLLDTISNKFPTMLGILPEEQA